MSDESSGSALTRTDDLIVAAAPTAADAVGDPDRLVAADSSLMRVHQHGASARRLSGTAGPCPMDSEDGASPARVVLTHRMD